MYRVPVPALPSPALELPKSNNRDQLFAVILFVTHISMVIEVNPVTRLFGKSMYAVVPFKTAEPPEKVTPFVGIPWAVPIESIALDVKLYLWSKSAPFTPSASRQAHPNANITLLEGTKFAIFMLIKKFHVQNNSQPDTISDFCQN